MYWFWKSCKPISVCLDCSKERIICLSSRYPKPVRFRGTRNEPLLGFLFGLAPDGVFRAASLALRAVGSYPTFSPLLRPKQASERYFLCGTVRRDDSRRRRPRVSQPNKPELRGIVLCGVRTFLPQLAPRAILRSSRTTIILRERLFPHKSRFGRSQIVTSGG